MTNLTRNFIEKARMMHGDKYDYSAVAYINAKTKVRIGRPIHGMFEQTPDKHLHCVNACPVCAGNRLDTLESFIEKAERVHGNRYDYSEVKYVNSKTAVRIICKTHGVFMQDPCNHLSGKGCPVCARNQRGSTDDFVQRVRTIHGMRYEYTHVDYQGNRVPVEIICRQHGSFMQRPYSHLSGSGCPVCGRITQIRHRDEVSIREKAVMTSLLHYGVSNPMKDPAVRKHHKDVVGSEAVREKSNATKRRNHSFNTSKPEIWLGNLLVSIFGEADVVSNYKSEVYPFRCDYYIKSRDMYIELNAHWSHGGRWFREGEDVTKLPTQSDTFSVRDVTKRKTAAENKLNYVVFWKCDLSDAKEWVVAGCPDAEDWKVEYSWKK